ncbi:hypothetical protein [Siphonobacter curvatus]|uniref:HTH cro/C1-type domain-containing protein n=1 Tax=Siphonobacter curvatus TaxID=2094562 RepID=A0A2S7INA4_9BACT|nr:hypothetical protein [Siphonobacter curvatus]PQA59136.1 hypothetical protein C5O19_05635 [Siphonobacter curvatus]
MSTINERFAQLIKALKMNNNSFAKSLGRTNTSIANIVDRGSKPGFELLEEIFEAYPEVNPIWLMRGTGEMFQAMTKVAADGGADVEKELRDKIKLQSEMINDLRYTVELQKRLLNNGDLGKPKGTVIDRLPEGFPFFLGLLTGNSTGTPVSLLG